MFIVSLLAHGMAWISGLRNVVEIDVNRPLGSNLTLRHSKDMANALEIFIVQLATDEKIALLTLCQ